MITTEKETQQLAAWDQIEAWLVDRLDHLTDEELLLVVSRCEGQIGLQPQDLLLGHGAFQFLSFAMLYEHRRRNGGFGRETFNPCSEQTL